MSHLKQYLLSFYPNLEEAAIDFGISRQTMYNYCTRSPEKILQHIPSMIAEGKTEVIAISEDNTLVQASVLDYIDLLYRDGEYI